MTRALIVAFTLFTLTASCLLHAARFPVSASTGPEVHCVAAAGRDGMVQLDCYGWVMQEAYERLVPRYAVYDALAPIAREFSWDLEWREVA
jgi:hypothetical protein